VGDASGAPGPALSDGLLLDVDPGEFARTDAPVRVEVAEGTWSSSLGAALESGPAGLDAREVRDGTPIGDPVKVQVERVSGGKVRLTWILAGETSAHTHRRFQADLATVSTGTSPWSFAERPDGALELK